MLSETTDATTTVETIVRLPASVRDRVASYMGVGTWAADDDCRLPPIAGLLESVASGAPPEGVLQCIAQVARRAGTWFTLWLAPGAEGRCEIAGFGPDPDAPENLLGGICDCRMIGDAALCGESMQIAAVPGTAGAEIYVTPIRNTSRGALVFISQPDTPPDEATRDYLDSLAAALSLCLSGWSMRADLARLEGELHQSERSSTARQQDDRTAVENHPEGGACTTVTIEAMQETSIPAPTIGQAAGRVRSREETPPSGRILVVDDETAVRMIVAAVLSKAGHQVDEAVDGQAALELAGSRDYDLIISDLRMPGIGGREFYERLVEARPGAAQRVIFTTGDAHGDGVADFLSKHRLGCLEKPFSTRHILELVNLSLKACSAAQRD